MSTKLTRKSLAFGAMFALVGSMVVATPAQAVNIESMTLTPATGNTYNSIIGTGLNLATAIDTGRNPTGNSKNNIGFATYIISNPSGADLTISLSQLDLGVGVETDVQGYRTYDADGDVDTGGSLVTTGSFTANRSVGFTAGSAGANVITTDATRIAVAAGTHASTNAALRNGVRPININSEGTDLVTVTVQLVADINDNGKINAFEDVSAVRTVNLYPATNVSATTTLTGMNQGISNATTRSVLSNDINAAQVAGALRFDVLRGSTVIDADNTIAAAASLGNSHVSDTRNLDATITAGFYTAQLYYLLGGVKIQLGAASPVVDLSEGSVAGITGAKATIAPNKDLAASSSNPTFTFLARAGVTTAQTITVQAVTNAVDRTAANIQVRATVTATKLAAGSTTTVSGSTSSLAKTGDSLFANGRTDATGKVNFTFTNAGAKNTDKLTVLFQVKDTNGAFVNTNATATVTLTYVNAVYTDLQVSPAAYVSGENPTVTFTARDQFKQGVDSNTAGKFSVYAVAVLSGVTSAATFEGLVATTAGKASFTFKNFAPANGQAVLRAQLIATKGTATVQQGNNVNVTVYNTVGTDKIAVSDQFLTNISYRDYVTGDLSDPAVVERVSKAGIVSGVTINGSVLRVNGAGQPGIPVTIESKDALFIDAGEALALDKITVFANEFGDFSVGVATHTVNTAGATVTISAGGKTATTLLKSYFPTGLSAGNLNFTSNMRGFLVKNKTYRVTMKLTDKWGNPVATTTASSTNGFTATGLGSVQINNSNTAFSGNFAADGSATLFIRSPRNIAGPGQLSISLGAANYSATSAGTATALNVTNVASDDVTTAWDERTFKSSTITNVEIFDVRPRATVTKPASGTTVVVTGARSAEVTVVRGKRSKSVQATSNSTRVVLKKGKGDVTVFVNGTRIAKR